MTSRRHALAGIVALLVLACFAYAPGLSGGFLFDDFVNLNVIGATGPIDNWATFFRYITSGTADPTGRPLALLSFLLDARDWPADPAPFLRTNLLLHLANGVLLFALLRMLGRALDATDKRVDAASLLATALWVLHPLLVSTTLYAVQREAMLPATFALLGLICYAHGRAFDGRGDWRRGCAWKVAGIVGGTSLAMLCKGNGILLPVLAWVVEATILRHHDDGKPSHRASNQLRWVLLTLPTLAVLAYLCSFLPHMDARLESRGWSIGQRLLSEPRIIADYLQLLLVPRSISTGLYNDGYLVSTGLLQPVSTLPSIVLAVLLPSLAWKYRTRFPSASAAVLFFFAGHLLESTVIPLELYFEHRNYLPAALLFWPVARGLCAWQIPLGWRGFIAALLVSLLVATTYQRTVLWGQPKLLAELWAQQNPASSRAQATIAMMDTSDGHPEQALRRLAPLWNQRPYDLQIAFNYVNAACAWHGISVRESQLLANALEHADVDLRLMNGWLESSMAIAASGQCTGLSLEESEAWLAAVSRNPRVASQQARDENLEPLRAILAMHRRRPDEALRHFDLALLAATTSDAAAQQSAMLASNGFYAQALAHLDLYESIKGRIRPAARGMPYLHEWVLERQGYWPGEMKSLRAKLALELAAKSAQPAVIQ